MASSGGTGGGGEPEPLYFYEDVVYRVNKRGNVELGIVMENDEQDASSGNDSPTRKKDEIRVVWHPTGVEENVHSKKVKLADRTLMPGDVVRRMIKGKDTQRGYCRDIELKACVQVLGTKDILADVKSEHFIPLEDFGSDVAVCMDSWVGGIKMVHYKLWLATPDGSKCVLNEIDTRGLEHFEEKRENDYDFPHSSEFYPSQSLWGPVQCLEEAHWIHCTKEMRQKRKSKMPKMIKVTVEKVETDWVGVHWQCRAYSGKESDNNSGGGGEHGQQPKFVVEGEDLNKLKLLNVFEPSTVQVGDRNFYVIRGNESVISKEQWKRKQREYFQVAKSSPKRPAKARLKKSAAEKRGSSSKMVVGEQQPAPAGAHCPRERGDNNKGAEEERDVEEDNSSDEWDTEEMADSDTASVSSGCSSMCSMEQKKKKSSTVLVTRVLKKKKLARAKKKPAPVPLVAGTKVVVETISTNTKASVVWQDGSIEYDIPSTQLFPIHHLDEKEFFPGDFVVDQKEEPRTYGVIQSVDHQGRMARVKWFKTYAFSQDPLPAFLEEREVSVYDLKDHPDFSYRPGTVVIRVANFEGEDANGLAGQVLDNFPEEGQVKVWWVDGRVSMCWPQDLYKVGEYDSDEGELWDDGSSEGSWETELEDCVVAEGPPLLPSDNQQQLSSSSSDSLKPKVAANIERARIAMSRLETIFTQIPSLQTSEVMRKLLDVYKDCRYIDKLMNTSFFHESHFEGLLERVRERGRANVAQKMADQVTRLFSQEGLPLQENNLVTADESVSENFEPLKDLDDKIMAASKLESSYDPESSNNLSSDKMSSSGLQTNAEDSGHFSTETWKHESGSSDSSGEFLMSEDVAAAASNAAESNSSKSKDSPEQLGAFHVCLKLCMLVKAQLILAHAEVTKRYGVSKTPTDAEEKREASWPPKDDESPPPPPAEQQQQQQQQQLNDELLQVELQDSRDVVALTHDDGEGFSVEQSAPDLHKFKLTMFQPTDPKKFFKAVSKELQLLRSSLPPGVWVKGFEDRVDLFSVMIRGPEKTPYEDGLLLFEFQLSADYPSAPPLCHYISYCSDRLNPNLYEDGKVCVSLLGTWAGRGTEVWTSFSTLLQIIVSIQGLILVPEPYFNEAGYEKQKGSQQGKENSRMYNEMAVLKLVQAQTKLIQRPPCIWKDIIFRHFKENAEKMIKRLYTWMEISDRYNDQHPMSPVSPTTFRELAVPQCDSKILPEFPLIPASKGFCITMKQSLALFKSVVIKKGIYQDDANSTMPPEDCYEEKTSSSSNADCQKETKKSDASQQNSR